MRRQLCNHFMFRFTGPQFCCLSCLTSSWPSPCCSACPASPEYSFSGLSGDILKFYVFSIGKNPCERSSMEEMRCSSMRSSSRFFSLFGGSFSRHWERPPPTYDESLKHINPDLTQQRPPDPPPYSDSFRARWDRYLSLIEKQHNLTLRFPLSRSLLALRSSQTGPSPSSNSSSPQPAVTTVSISGTLFHSHTL